HQSRVPWWRCPFRGVYLFDVVHQIKADCSWRSGVQGGENAGLAVGWNLGRALKTRVAHQFDGKIAAFGDTAVLGGNRGLPDPLLETLDGLVVTFSDLVMDHVQLAGFRRASKMPLSEDQTAGGGSFEKAPAIDGRHGVSLQRPVAGAREKKM